MGVFNSSAKLVIIMCSHEMRASPTAILSDCFWLFRPPCWCRCDGSCMCMPTSASPQINSNEQRNFRRSCRPSHMLLITFTVNFKVSPTSIPNARRRQKPIRAKRARLNWLNEMKWTQNLGEGWRTKRNEWIHKFRFVIFERERETQGISFARRTEYQRGVE